MTSSCVRSCIAYRRVIDGEIVEFGTTGKLYNSNLLMYDRKTDTWWTQIGGLAVVGELTGQRLEAISIDIVVWRDWKTAHPDSEVLSQDTGFPRSYGTDPYGNYYEDTFIMFPLTDSDERIHPKTVVFGIEVDGQHKAYREDDLVAAGRIKDDFAGRLLAVERDASEMVAVTDLSTGDKIVKERDFWFAWNVFHPETALWGAPTS
ncbi:MAG: DUF3179 domain-containing (seleno)protein [archaeon]